jgi:hypothetical protein
MLDDTEEHKRQDLTLWLTGPVANSTNKPSLMLDRDIKVFLRSSLLVCYNISN